MSKEKGERLGKFEAAPMVSTIVDLYGLDAKGAVDIVSRKIARALRAEARTIKLVHGGSPEKIRKKVLQYLTTVEEVASVDDSDPSVTVVELKHG